MSTDGKWTPKGVTPDDLTKIVRKTLDTGNPLSAGMSLEEMLGALVNKRHEAEPVEVEETEAPKEVAGRTDYEDEPAPSYDCAMCGKYMEYETPFVLTAKNYSDNDIKLCSQGCLIRFAIIRDLDV